jgi:Fe-S-cluster containining protein
MFVRCPKCGNNCCNAGFGEVTTEGLPKEKLGDIGITCDVCNLAYQYQHLAWDTKMAPEPTDEMIKEAELQNKLYWEEIFGEDKI